jgi:hypothetical protein
VTARETTLTPTEDLLVEVLAARHRTGETVWTFATTHARTVRTLADKGLVAWKSGVLENTILAWLTDAGRAYALDEGYAPPASRETTLGALTAADLGKRVRVDECDGVLTGVLHESRGWSTARFGPMSSPMSSDTPVTVYDKGET